jgi:hypothetical protein
LRELVDAALVAPAGEIAAEEGRDTGLGHVRSDQPSPKRKDIGVIVRPRQFCRQRLTDMRAAAAWVTIDCDGDADARSADGDTALSSARAHDAGKLRSIFRIIDALRAVGAEILDLMALVTQPRHEFILEEISGMIGGEGDAHGECVSQGFRIRQRLGRPLKSGTPPLGC